MSRKAPRGATLPSRIGEVIASPPSGILAARRPRIAVTLGATLSLVVGFQTALPAAAHAQERDAGQSPWTFSAFGAWLPGYHLPEVDAFTTPAAGVQQHVRLWDMGARFGAGMDVSYDLAHGFLVVTGVRREADTQGGVLCLEGDGCILPLREEASLVVAHLAPGWTTGGPVPVTGYIGPSLSFGDSSASDFGLMLGALVDVPVHIPGLSLRLGVEDRLAFWDSEAPDVEVDGPLLDPGSTHLVAFRAGLAYRP